MLLGVAKAVLAAGIIAFLYPPSGQVRSFEWLVAALAISGILAYIGLSLDEEEHGKSSRQKKGR